MHSKLEIHFDRDDDVDMNEIYRTGGSTFEDSLGEILASWEMRSKEEVIETLMDVCEILCKTPGLLFRKLAEIKP